VPTDSTTLAQVRPGHMTPPSPADGAAGARPPVTAWHLYLLLGAMGLFYLVTLRSGQPWHDDFALYVLHARNLVEGRAYGETGFVYNPADPWHSPRVYPPGFPLLLAPLYALFGLNLDALRLVVIASAIAAVATFVALIRPLLPPRLVLPAAALFAFQPFLLRFKNLLLPDLPFLLFVLLSLHLLLKLQEEGTEPRRRSMARALLTGACLYFAVALRAVGVALFAAVPLYYVLRLQLPSRRMLTAFATALLLYGAQLLLMPRDSGYLAQISDVLSRHSGAAATTARDAEPAPRPTGEEAVPAAVPAPSSQTQQFEDEAPAIGGDAPGSLPALAAYVGHRARALFFMSAVFWAAEGELAARPFGKVARAVAGLLMITTLLLALLGYVLRLRRLTVIETFTPVYLGLILLWGFPSARYMIPLVPLLVLYGFTGGAFLAARGGRAGRLAAIGIAGMVAAVYVVNLPRTPSERYARGVTSPAATALFEYVQRCTPAEARFLSFRPRALALFGERQATSVTRGMVADEERLYRLMDEMRLDYVMASSGSNLDALAANRPDFETTYRNDRYAVFRYLRSEGSASSIAGCP
jgi:hypothetical protein